MEITDKLKEIKLISNKGDNMSIKENRIDEIIDKLKEIKSVKNQIIYDNRIDEETKEFIRNQYIKQTKRMSEKLTEIINKEQ